jgi:hypothetical protein
MRWRKNGNGYWCDKAVIASLKWALCLCVTDLNAPLRAMVLPNSPMTWQGYIRVPCGYLCLGLASGVIPLWGNWLHDMGCAKTLWYEGVYNCSDPLLCHSRNSLFSCFNTYPLFFATFPAAIPCHLLLVAKLDEVYKTCTCATRVL